MRRFRTLIYLQLCLLAVPAFDLSAVYAQDEWQVENNQPEYLDDSQQLDGEDADSPDCSYSQPASQHMERLCGSVPFADDVFFSDYQLGDLPIRAPPRPVS